MTFAGAPQVGERLTALIAQADPRTVIVECSAVPDLEHTALRALTALEERLRGQGIELWLAALNPTALKVVKRSALDRGRVGNGCSTISATPWRHIPPGSEDLIRQMSPGQLYYRRAQD
jgi:MFS superfamily sulfate permease-like transporter